MLSAQDGEHSQERHLLCSTQLEPLPSVVVSKGAHWVMGLASFQRAKIKPWKLTAHGQIPYIIALFHHHFFLALQVSPYHNCRLWSKR
jgi:hypothetical protein